jgi:hypothetical protein
MAPQPPAPQLPVFFNVDSVVGAAPAQNLREDVLLVQFCLRVIGLTPKETTDLLVAAACKLVQTTGVIDPQTIAAIKAVQLSTKKRDPSVVVDSRVSPAKGGYTYGAWWTIAYLNGSVQNRNKSVWPRIDKIQGCPVELLAMLRRVLVGE